TALETGAATGTRFSEVVSATAKKLQITWALSRDTAEEIDRLTAELADEQAFAEFRELCQRDAVYITALTRIHRQADRKSTRLNSSHVKISYAVFCLKKKKKTNTTYKQSERIKRQVCNQ